MSIQSQDTTSDLTRDDDYEFEDGTSGRVYIDSNGNRYGSCSTIAKTRIDPEKEEAIDGWRDFYDGSTDYRSPHWSDQRQYKGYRGTLGHYVCFDGLTNRDLFSDEEQHAIDQCKQWGEYDGEDMYDRCMRQVNWIKETFDDEVRPDLSLDPDSLVDCERFVVNHDHYYAGQYDLVYERPDGTTVLADLKTGSGIRYDAKLQTEAYSHAVRYDVDELEVIHVDPDDEDWNVETNDDWDVTRTELWREYQYLAAKFQRVKLGEPI